MSPHELLRHCGAAENDPALAERILDVLEALSDEVGRLRTLHTAAQTSSDAIGVAALGHRTFLPACREYRDHIRGHNRSASCAGFRRRRARLGAASRWLYAAQRKTFDDVLDLLVPSVFSGLLSDSLRGRLWRQIQTVERFWLALDRRR